MDDKMEDQVDRFSEDELTSWLDEACQDTDEFAESILKESGGGDTDVPVHEVAVSEITSLPPLMGAPIPSSNNNSDDSKDLEALLPILGEPIVNGKVQLISDEDSYESDTKMPKLFHQDRLIQQATLEHVLGLTEKWVGSIATLVPKRVSNLYGKHAVFEPLTGHIRIGRESINNYFWDFMKQVSTLKRSSECEVRAGYGGCVANQNYEITMASSNTQIKATSRFVYAFEEDEWKIVHHKFSIVPELVSELSLDDVRNTIDDAENNQRINGLKASRLRDYLRSDSLIEIIHCLVTENIPLERKGSGYKCKVCLVPKKGHRCIYCHVCSTPESKNKKEDHLCEYCHQCFEAGKEHKKEVKILRGSSECPHKEVVQTKRRR